MVKAGEQEIPGFLDRLITMQEGTSNQDPSNSVREDQTSNCYLPEVNSAPYDRTRA